MLYVVPGAQVPGGRGFHAEMAGVHRLDRFPRVLSARGVDADAFLPEQARAFRTPVRVQQRFDAQKQGVRIPFGREAARHSLQHVRRAVVLPVQEIAVGQFVEHVRLLSGTEQAGLQKGTGRIGPVHAHEMVSHGVKPFRVFRVAGQVLHAPRTLEVPEVGHDPCGGGKGLRVGTVPVEEQKELEQGLPYSARRGECHGLLEEILHGLSFVLVLHAVIRLAESVAWTGKVLPCRSGRTSLPWGGFSYAPPAGLEYKNRTPPKRGPGH